MMAVVLDVVGKKFQKLAGYGTVFVTAGFFIIGTLTAKKLLPSIMGVSIPNFAYLIIFAAMANILGIIPENVRRGNHPP